MAFSSGSNGFSGGRNGRRYGSTPGALAEMNVVPLVDVVLVLLIIFMLTAHVMEFGLQIDVPQVTEVRETVQDLPVINISRSGQLYLGDKKVNINEVSDLIAQRYKGAKAVYVRADRRGQIENLVQVVNILGQAHFGINLVAKPVDLGMK